MPSSHTPPLMPVARACMLRRRGSSACPWICRGPMYSHASNSNKRELSLMQITNPATYGYTVSQASLISTCCSNSHRRFAGVPVSVPHPAYPNTAGKNSLPIYAHAGTVTRSAAFHHLRLQPHSFSRRAQVLMLWVQTFL